MDLSVAKTPHEPVTLGFVRPSDLNPHEAILRQHGPSEHRGHEEHECVVQLVAHGGAVEPLRCSVDGGGQRSTSLVACGGGELIG